MEFLYKSYLQTSTQIAVQSSTLLADRIMSRDPTTQWISSGYNDDNTTTSMVISFDMTTSLSRIALDGINLKQFKLFYNGATANTFALTSTAATTTSDFSNNSETSMMLSFTPVNVTSITLEMKSTQVANSEKAVGYLLPSAVLLDFERIPSASQYTPRVDSEEVVHRMSDGGTKINVKDRKRNTDIKLKYISESFRDDLLEVYETIPEFLFSAFPTTTGWDRSAIPCVWEGDFDGYKYSDNNPTAGFDVSIKIREIPT